MANASPRDTRAGFDIYRSHGGEIPLEDLNSCLLEAGYGPVAVRSYDHFAALLEAGYSRYVAINRFDVARASAPYENASAMGRYDYRAADLGVQVVFAKGSGLHEASGRAHEVGEVGAILQFQDEEVVAGLRKLKPQPGNMVTIRYLEAGKTVSGRVVNADLKGEPAAVEIEYARLISIASVGLGDPLPVAQAEYLLEGPADQLQTFDLVNRRLFHFFELIEGVRAVVNQAGASQPSPVYAEPPVLRRLSVASPAILTIDVASLLEVLLPAGLVGALLKALGALPAKRSEWYKGTGQKLDNEGKMLELEMKRLKAEAKRAEVELKTEVIALLRRELPDSTVSDESLSRGFDESLLPPLRALGEIGIESVRPGADADDT